MPKIEADLRPITIIMLEDVLWLSTLAEENRNFLEDRAADGEFKINEAAGDRFVYWDDIASYSAAGSGPNTWSRES